jgi:hypothetical protein
MCFVDDFELIDDIVDASVVGKLLNNDSELSDRSGDWAFGLP